MKCRISIAVLMAAFLAMAADEFSLDDAPAPKPSPIAYTDHFEVGAGYHHISNALGRDNDMGDCRAGAGWPRRLWHRSAGC